MNESDKLKEREKELKCLYATDKLLESENDLFKLLTKLCLIISEAFLYPQLARVKIKYYDLVVSSPYFYPQKNHIEVKINENGKSVGEVFVCYTSETEEQSLPFLREEQDLLNAVGKKLSDYFRIRSSSCFLAVDKKNIFSIVRNKICQNSVQTMNFKEFGINCIYLIGSVKNFTAGINSDIDLIIYYDGLKRNKDKIKIWFEAWSASTISDIQYENEIKNTDNLFDIHLITDEDIKSNNSYAVMINSMYNNAKLIKSV